MNKTLVMNLAIWVCNASLLFAQTTAQVQKADLAIPFGTLGALMAKGNDVQVASGTEIAMSFDREVSIPANR